MQRWEAVIWWFDRFFANTISIFLLLFNVLFFHHIFIQFYYTKK